jgi:glycosyltransferase involved in cell wall biosynthesis
LECQSTYHIKTESEEVPAMKIAILSAAENGGAGNAAKNLQTGLVQAGIDAGFLSEQKVIDAGGNVFSKLKRWWLVRKNIKRNYSYLKNAPAGYDHFSFARTGYQQLYSHPLVKQADVINLHWVSYLVDYPSFFKNISKPIIWTLHDTNLFTGGCHYTFGCDNYLHDCANCPQLAEPARAFAAKDNLQLKQDSLKKLDPEKVVVVAPSQWLKALSQKSTLFKTYPHYVIPYGIATDTFKYQDKTASRIKMGLPLDKFIVLFAGTSIAEHRKGFDIILKLSEALQHRDDILFVAVGKTEQSYTGILNLGYIADKSGMATAYSAADVYIIPSREDNLPNTLLESLCCGTPVIGYKTGGIPDAIEPGENGFLVEKENVTDIVQHINKMADGPGAFNREAIADAARKKYSLEKQAGAYREIINKVFLVQ